MTHPEPIFLAGPDRSGTSLIYTLLASHPNIAMVRRTNMWRYFYGRFGDLSDAQNLERCLTSMVTFKRMRHLLPDPDRIRREFQQGEPTYGRLFALFYEHHAERMGKPRWGDKSLHTEHYAGKILMEYPNAKIIHMMRDPRDRAASMMKRYEKNQGRVAAATGRWLSSAKVAQRNQSRYPGNYKVLRYETLVERPEETLREVCTFINEAYAPEMLQMDAVPEMKNRGGNSSYGTFERAVISTRSVGRYREVLSPSDIRFIELFAKRDMDRYDYRRDGIDLSPRDGLAFYAAELPFNSLRMAGWLALQAWTLNHERIPAAKIMADMEEAE